MANSPSEKEIRQALAKIKHPEIECTLVDLGMLKNFSMENKKVTITLKLPVMGIPAQVKDYLVNSINQALANLDASFEGAITLALMSPEERSQFFTLARANWTG